MASWVLNGPLTIVIVAVCLFDFARWMPEYLTWPLWADHDVFSAAALSWEVGLAPYRDVLGNNFPGTLYILWLLGKLVGFGWPLGPAFHALDAALVGLFAVALMSWGRRVLGGRLPGAVAMAAFLGYYFNLDYGLVAQRDWQGPVFVVMGLMSAQAISGRSGRLWSCVLCIIGVMIRPQVVLLIPAVLWVVGERAATGRRAIVLAIASWLLLFVLGMVVSFSPIILQGLWPDFLRSLGILGLGGPYNQVTPASFVEEFLKQFRPIRLFLVPAAIGLLLPGAGRSAVRVAIPWLIAFAGVSVYAPISPHAHAYLAHPLTLVWCGLLAILVHLVLGREVLPPSTRLAILLLVCGLAVTLPSRLVDIGTSVRALSSLRHRAEPRREPTGYHPTPGHGILGQYPWADYRDLLVYLRTETRTSTRIANGLMMLPAVVGPAGRLSAFPAESVAWLKVVRPEDEERFARSLREASDSLVVWAPSEKGAGQFPRLEQVYRAYYEFRRSFGVIEVWTRKDRPAAEGSGTTRGSLGETQAADSGRERRASVSIQGSKAPLRSD